MHTKNTPPLKPPAGVDCGGVDCGGVDYADSDYAGVDCGGSDYANSSSYSSCACSIASSAA